MRKGERKTKAISCYTKLFVILFLASLALRFAWLNAPPGRLIFDEFWYVNAAHVILGLPQIPIQTPTSTVFLFSNATAGVDPNSEHPATAKLLIALSIKIFGDNGYGWRIPSVIAGMISILFFYMLMCRLTKTRKAPLVATFLFAFDNMVFVQSRIGMLDIFMLASMLAGFYFYFSGSSRASALALALSTGIKFTGIFGVLVIVCYHFAKNRNVKRVLLANIGNLAHWLLEYLAIYSAAFILLIAATDRWTKFSNPIAHIVFMLQFAAKRTGTCYPTITNPYAVSCPWQWPLNITSIPYLVDPALGANFYGAFNPAIIGLIAPAIAYSVFSYVGSRKTLPLFVLVWFAGAYLPYYPLVLLFHRMTYLFYFLPAFPAICAALAHFVDEQNVPRWAILGYLAFVVFAFAYLFPIRPPV